MAKKKSFDYVLGTAGHIDHGKSTLIKALTGIDPDRLKEEKDRGITIELGFAQLELPGGTKMGVVDVPGHERFVRQMISGATGIDIALLVIAADDGVMPQTIEHMAVLQTLGIARCVVALTKTDLVDDEWVEMMKGEVEAWLATTPYAGCPVIPVSARERTGLDELLRAIENATAGAERVRGGNFVRYPIDRVFTVKGAGTVVTGTLWSGAIHVDDVLELLPGGLPCKVRSIQEHGVAVDEALAGNRVALNISGIDKEQVAPGDFLAEPGLIRPTDRFDARLTYLDADKSGKPLETGVRMHVAHGTREVLGRVLLADGLGRLEPGQSAYAQIRLEEPLPVSSGDRFVVRTFSPVKVAGGGAVLIAHPRRRTNLDAHERAALDALSSGKLQGAVDELLYEQRAPVAPAELASAIGVEAKPVAACLIESAQAGRACLLGTTGLYASRPLRQKAITAIDHTLIDFHAKHPAETGIPAEELRQLIFPRMESAQFNALVGEAIASGVAVMRAGRIGHPGAQASAVTIIENAADALHAELEGEGMSPQPFEYVLRDAGVDASLAGQALTMLLEQGRVRKVDDDIYYADEVFAEAMDRVRLHLQAGGDGSAKALKEVMGTSRRYAIPLLEAFDKVGLTVRQGDVRTLRQP